MTAGRRSGVGRLALAAAGVVALCAAVVFAASSSAVISAQSPKRVLLLTHSLFYNHSNLQTIEDVLPAIGAAAGFSLTSLQGWKQTTSCTTQKPCTSDVVDLSMVTPTYLTQFDAIVFSTNGELPFSGDTKAALVDFVRKDGKGMVFLHQSVVTNYGWRQWGELLGAYMGTSALFDGTNSAKRSAVMKIEDAKHPATRHLPEHWTLDDEFYQFGKVEGELGPTRLPVPMVFDRSKVHVLVSFDSERTDFSAVKGYTKGGDYPQVWLQQLGKGRTFYTAIGHREDLWRTDATYRQFISQAIRWVLDLER